MPSIHGPIKVIMMKRAILSALSELFQPTETNVVTPPNGLECGHGHFSQKGKLDLNMVIKPPVALQSPSQHNPSSNSQIAAPNYVSHYFPTFPVVRNIFQKSHAQAAC